jgi:hypothetical protein
MVGEPWVVPVIVEDFQPVLGATVRKGSFTDSLLAPAKSTKNSQGLQVISDPNNDDLVEPDRRATFYADGTRRSREARITRPFQHRSMTQM